MKKIINLGSLNLDKVYLVEKFVQPGESIHALRYSENCGGKGLNQSIAMARAGAYVYHAGKIGKDGIRLRDCLKEAGVETSFLEETGAVSGHALIQVEQSGQNSIIVHRGANDLIQKDYISNVLEKFSPEDVLVLQNEISNVDYAIIESKKRGLRVVFNPSPIDENVLEYKLSDVDCFILNENEAGFLAGISEFDEDNAISRLREKYPEASFVMTLGEKGSYYFDRSRKFYQEIFRVDAVDTTGAGDTFCGYYVAGMIKGLNIPERLYLASAAAAMAVCVSGAAQSVPHLGDVNHFLAARERKAI